MSNKNTKGGYSIISLSIAMLLHRRLRLLSSIVVLALAFFLTQAQVGLLYSWIDTTTAIITHAQADLWIMAPKTCAFEYGTPIMRESIYQVRSIPGVAYAEGMVVDWSFWQRQDGARINIQLVGLDKGLLGGPWSMQTGDVSSIFMPYRVVVDSLYLNKLGVNNVGDEFDIIGHKAIVGAISRDVRTFTASPFVFASLSDISGFDPRYNPDEITYVLAQCDPATTPEEARDRIRVAVPHLEVLTAKEFTARTACYWILNTGAGITVVITAVLGLLVGTLIANQTLYSITQDHVKDYAMLLAIGFSKTKLTGVVVAQSLFLGGSGAIVGGMLFYPAMIASMQTPVPIVTTPIAFIGIILVSLLSCVVASWMSVRTIFGIDPVTVFSQ